MDQQIGALTQVDTARTVGIVASLFSPGDSMWRLGVYYLQPAISRGVQIGPFGTSSVPSPLMVWWTIGFTSACARVRGAVVSGNERCDIRRIGSA